MASIRCAHCKSTHGSVAEVRACSTPAPAPAHVPFEDCVTWSTAFGRRQLIPSLPRECVTCGTGTELL